MGKFWRALSLRLPVFIYLLLLQLCICWYFYFHALTSAQIFQEVASANEYANAKDTFIFFTMPVSRWLVGLDVLRPILLILLFCQIKSPYFYMAALMLMLSYRNDLQLPYLVFSESDLAGLPTTARSPDLPTWRVNLLFNRLARFSLLYEILMRLWVVALVIERWRVPNQEGTSYWSYSLFDLLIFIAIFALTIMLFR